MTGGTVSVHNGAGGDSAERIRRADRLGNPVGRAGLPFCISMTEKIRMEDTRMKKAAIIMGSDSDLPIAEKAIGKLRELGIPFEVHV